MRLEFRLNKKSKGRWKLKSLIVFLVLVGMTALYFSPVGEVGRSFVQKTWAVLTERAHWQLEQVIVEGHKRTDKKTILNALNIDKNQSIIKFKK